MAKIAVLPIIFGAI